MRETLPAARTPRLSRAEPHAVRALRALWARPAAWLLRALAATWRVEVRGDDPFAPGAARPVLGALWHQGALIAAGVFRDRGVHVAVSLSRDGGHIAAVLHALGFGESLRGSSSRAAAQALLGAVRQLGGGSVVALLVDGPRGPALVAKSGVVAAARLAGTPVLPVALAASPCVRFASWDRMRLPLPFARVLLHYGEPLPVPADASDAEVEALRGRLEERLRTLSQRLDAELASAADSPARS
jgi:lysophospholipid acyltransferase (LPLAT)-like uncharacterized protein